MTANVRRFVILAPYDTHTLVSLQEHGATSHKTGTKGFVLLLHFGRDDVLHILCASGELE